MEIEIIAAIFLWFLKQQLNFQLLLEDWYWEKWELTDLPGHVEKVTAEKKVILSLIKGIWVEIEIIVAIFSDISKQQVNFQLLL